MCWGWNEKVMHSRVTRTSEHLVSFENLSFMFSENKTLLNFYFKEINVLPIKTLINTRNKRKTICIFFRRLIAVRQECGTKPSDSLNLWKVFESRESNIKVVWVSTYFIKRKNSKQYLKTHACMYIKEYML